MAAAFEPAHTPNRASLYRVRAQQFTYLAEHETAAQLKARYLQLATCWHDLAIAAEQGWIRSEMEH
ncbi:MAG TPA: hypothetical protein VGG10_10620 [Rhizomicrobium sp.]|jgi:hypothetical protein